MLILCMIIFDNYYRFSMHQLFVCQRVKGERSSTARFVLISQGHRSVQWE